MVTAWRREAAGSGIKVKAGIVVAVTLVLLAAVCLHVRGVNGPWYWTWPWRRLTWWMYPAMALAAGPFFLAQWLHAKNGWRASRGIWLVAVSTLLLELAALAVQPPYGLARLPAAVQHAGATSYYTDAVIVSENLKTIAPWEWFFQYPDIVPMMHLHARYKPPGLVLFYLALVEIFGKGAVAASAGGVIIAMLAAAAVPATYRMLKLYGGDEEAAFCGASYLALCPALILFLPQFDQVYPAMACVMLTLWGRSVRDGRLRAAIGCGAMLALGLFCSYIFLILGFFFAAYLMLSAAYFGPKSAARAAGNGVIALLTIVALYGLMWTFLGFDPIATFHAIARMQANDLLPLVRPFPRHILFDVLDFALASGWISFVLVAFYLMRFGRSIFGRSPRDRLVLLALLQIGVVAGAALLPGESARLWMLLLPLLVAPIGFELRDWRFGTRMIAYACVWLLMVAIGQNMIFVYLGGEIDPKRTLYVPAYTQPLRRPVAPAGVSAPGPSSAGSH